MWTSALRFTPFQASQLKPAHRLWTRLDTKTSSSSRKNAQEFVPAFDPQPPFESFIFESFIDLYTDSLASQESSLKASNTCGSTSRPSTCWWESARLRLPMLPAIGAWSGQHFREPRITCYYFPGPRTLSTRQASPAFVKSSPDCSCLWNMRSCIHRARPPPSVPMRTLISSLQCWARDRQRG
jgi:hypothetical protein